MKPNRSNYEDFEDYEEALGDYEDYQYELKRDLDIEKINSNIELERKIKVAGAVGTLEGIIDVVNSDYTDKARDALDIIREYLDLPQRRRQ